MTGFEWRAMAMAGAGGGQQQSPAFMFVWLALMVGVFYFILIRPQQRREKEKRLLLDALKTGDRVVFAGGLIGIISNVKDKLFVIKIADNVKVEVAKYSVVQVLDKGETPDTEPEKK
ncbi:MAG: preprotein translocase subunit YajC [Kiritimatiellia bacterium]|nr:preprotein translocase subunit YajC [Kiritimatiellia bacterium]